MDWRIKVAKLAVLGRLPFGNHLRAMKRSAFGYEPDPTNLRGTLANFELMKSSLQQAGKSFKGLSILEIGSGWFPAIPIMLALEGAKKVTMTDLNVHMDVHTFKATLNFLRSFYPDDKRLKEISAIEDLPLEYLAPFKVSKVPDGSVDCVVSRTVLEHIFPDDLSGLLRALHPKLSTDGVMVHLIDHSDHLEHGDKSISKINFLTWSNENHALVNRLIKEGENRLRHHQYRPVFEAAGYRIVNETTVLDEATKAIAGSLKLVHPFASMTPEQLAIMTSVYTVGK